MPRYKLTIEYDGTFLAGWQKQDNASTAQGFLEKAIYEYCQQQVITYAAGRTDAGVHAAAQIVHCDLEISRSEYSIRQGLNQHLKGRPVVVLAVDRVESDFHARFSAKARIYRYVILNRPTPPILELNRVWWIPRMLNETRMQIASQRLVGNHDFTSFRASGCQASSPVRTIDKIEVTRDGEKILLDLAAPSFLYHQVRNITGALKEVGTGKINADDITEILMIKDRSKAPAAAPASGLYFIGAEY